MAKDVDMEGFLRWAYKEQLVDRILTGVGLSGGARGYSEASAFTHDFVDAGAIAAQDVHPDAEALHHAVQGLTRDEYRLVVSCARVGTRPDWMPGAVPFMRGRRHKDGTIVYIYRNGHKIGCEMEYGLMAENIRFARLSYLVWWQAVNWLAVTWAPSAGLTAHRVTGFNAVEEPWSSVKQANISGQNNAQKAA